MPIQFHEPEQYRPAEVGYRLLPFQFIRWSATEILMVNQAGEFLFLSQPSFTRFVNNALVYEDSLYSDLKSKHFLIDGDSSVAVQLLATKYRSKKSFLDGFTKLHLFVVTLRCDHSCPYCQVSRVSMDRERYDMSLETARRSVDLMLRSPSPNIKVEFQGGEPLLNLDIIREIIDYTEAKKDKKHVEYVIATNLSHLDDEALIVFREHDVLVSTSLDGPESLHNGNRPRPGNDSYRRTIEGITKARSVLGIDRVSALMTTTADSLRYPREIIDEYVKREFTSIFLRPISPYGFAVRSKMSGAYHADTFLDFYRQGLDYIIKLNRQGILMVEVYAQLLLTKILTPFATGYVDLQSPTGAGINVVAYNYDGDVYASDEARMLGAMGDHTFRLGNVRTHTYEQMFGGSIAQMLVESSVVESLPGCADCAFQMYCGGDPIFHYATQQDLIGHRPTSDFCRRNMSIIKYLFRLLHDEDDFTKRLLMSWATRVTAE